MGKKKDEYVYGRHFSLIQTANTEVVPALQKVQAKTAAMLWKKYKIISYDAIQSGTPPPGCGIFPKPPC